MFHLLDDSWPRRELFQHYMHTLRCTYSLTVNIDVTGLRAALKENGVKAYPAQVYLLARAVNQFPAFRMGLDDAGQPGYWDTAHPAYTVFHPETETFSSLWTPYDKSFASFYDAVRGDIERYANNTAFAPQEDTPPNIFNVSSLPWVDFTAFNLNVFAEGTHLPPIFTLGRYIEQNGTTQLPLALQLHHAACDGYHAGQFVQAVRELAGNYKDWL